MRWARSLSEEYGMLSTYGGRTNFPIVFENLVIISGVTTGWGEAAVPAHRFVAFDKLTGQAVWFASTRPRPEDTTYCTPIITSFNGQLAMVFGGGDGSRYMPGNRARAGRSGSTTPRIEALTRLPSCVTASSTAGHANRTPPTQTVLGSLFAFDGRRQGQIAETDLLWKIPACGIGAASR